MALSAGPGSQALPQSIVRMLALPLAEATGDTTLAQSEHNGNARAVSTIDNMLPPS